MHSNKTTQVRLLYLTCTEIIVNYGIFDTQVKSLLKVLAEKYEDSVTVHLFSLMPILRLLRFPKWQIENVFYHNKESFRKLQMELSEADIQTSFRPLLSVYPFDTWRLWEMALTLPLAVVMLAFYLRRNRINLLHCRSYHAGLLGLIMMKLLGVPYIFDPRALWVEEQVLKGKWSENSWSHRLWKSLEKMIVRNAYSCIAVSDPMKEIFVSSARRVEAIYTTVGAAHLEQFDRPDTKSSIEELNILQSLQNSHHLFVFNTGTFNIWNSLDHLLDRYKQLCQIVSPSALAIVTRTPQELIYKTASVYEIDLANLVILSLSSDLVPTVLRQCHYGLLVRPETIQSPIEMSIKFAEYLAAGLPVICDEYIGGAAHVIREHEVGILLSNNWDKNREALNYLRGSYDEVSNRCRSVAERLFSVNVHADRYAKLYQEVVAYASHVRSEA